MTPIISPIWFYLIHFSSALSNISSGLVYLIGVIGIVLGVVSLVGSFEYGDQNKTVLTCIK